MEESIQGLSGARIWQQSDGTITKTTASDMAWRQGRFMNAAGTAFFPRVDQWHRYDDGSSCLNMERLQPWQHLEADPLGFLTDVKPKLEDLWQTRCYGDHPVGWHKAMTDYLARTAAPEWLVKTHFFWRGTNIMPVTIHGDCTFENVMMRGRQYVFIDPLSSGDKIPAWKHVDLAKLMQSVLGWEWEIRGLPWFMVHDTQRVPLERIVLHGLDLWERGLVWYWTAVHLHRIRPYTKDNQFIIEWLERKIEYCHFRLKELDLESLRF